ncbi:hypothetical protein HpNP61_11570 [Helicobacter pylori]
MQMLFDKINNGSPFGVIKEVFFYDYSPNNPNNSPQLKQFLEYKRHFVGVSQNALYSSSDLLLRKQARHTKHRHKRDKIPECTKS